MISSLPVYFLRSRKCLFYPLKLHQNYFSHSLHDNKHKNTKIDKKDDVWHELQLVIMTPPFRVSGLLTNTACVRSFSYRLSLIQRRASHCYLGKLEL